MLPRSGWGGQLEWQSDHRAVVSGILESTCQIFGKKSCMPASSSLRWSMEEPSFLSLLWQQHDWGLYSQTGMNHVLVSLHEDCWTSSSLRAVPDCPNFCLRYSRDRHVCNSAEESGSPLYVAFPGRESLGNRCPANTLEWPRFSLYLPSSSHSTPNSGKEREVIWS